MNDHWTCVTPGGRPPEKTRAFYNRISGVYDALAARSEGAIWREAVRLLEPRPGDRVFEAGTGTGDCVLELAGRTGAPGCAVGVDISDGMLAVAARKSRSARQPRPRFVLADARRLPFQACAFDAGAMVFTLELFDTDGIAQVLSECYRILRPGGRLVVASLAKGSPRTGLVRAAEWLHRVIPRWMDCRPIYAAEALAAAGYRVERREEPRWWLPVELVLSTTRRSRGGDGRRG